jgi:hypothetical protein
MTGHELRSAAVAAGSHFLLFLAANSVSVFGLGQYEPAWGQAHTWEVLCWLGAGSAILVFIGAMFGSIFASRAGRTLPRVHAMLAGAITAALLIGLLYLKRAFGIEGGMFFAVVGTMLIPFWVAVKFSAPE